MLYRTSAYQLFADAFFIREGRLMFASLHGRDAEILALLAAITAGNQLHDLGFTDESGDRAVARYFSGLNKQLTKYQTDSYGVLTHMFLYADELVEMNPSNKSAWVILKNENADMDKAIGECVRELTDVPLQEHWLPTVAAHLERNGHIVRYQPKVSYYTALVGLQACSVYVPDDFADDMSSLLQSRELLPA